MVACQFTVAAMYAKYVAVAAFLFFTSGFRISLLDGFIWT